MWGFEIFKQKHKQNQKGHQKQVFQAFGFKNIDIIISFHFELLYFIVLFFITGIRETTHLKTQISREIIIKVTTISCQDG